MITSNTEHTLQMELDFEIDAERLDRQEWQRAIDRNLHALTDYVDPHQLIIWQPGNRQRGIPTGFDVQLTTLTICTCSRFKLRDRCEHVVFVERLEAAGIVPGTETPTRSVEIAESETAA